MTINFRAPEVTELKPRITVLGVGGAGGNAVNNMITSKLEGVSFVVANTDAQALHQSKANRKIQLGAKLTEGLGAGAKPEVGRGAAEESIDEILEHLSGSHMVFVTAGMGGGTGTGAAPVIARAVRELGVLTVGVVTKPFHFEGDKRMKVAERGIEELQNFVDTLIVIPNQNLFRVANERTTFAQAFSMADDVLHSGVRGITDLIVMPGLINRDFADIRTVMSEMGKAMMGTGEMEGEGRALAGGGGRDLQSAARRRVDEGRARRAHQRHRRTGPDAVRGRRGGEPYPRRGRLRRQYPLRQRAVREHGRARARLRRRHRHRRRIVLRLRRRERAAPACSAPPEPSSPKCRRRAAVPAPRMSIETSAVGRMVDNLAVQLDTLQMTAAPSLSCGENPHRSFPCRLPKCRWKSRSSLAAPMRR